MRKIKTRLNILVKVEDNDIHSSISERTDELTQGQIITTSVKESNPSSKESKNCDKWESILSKGKRDKVLDSIEK